MVQHKSYLKKNIKGTQANNELSSEAPYNDWYLIMIGIWKPKHLLLLIDLWSRYPPP